MSNYFKYYIIKNTTGTKEHCLKALWLCRCVQAWCWGGGPTSGGVLGVGC